MKDFKLIICLIFVILLSVSIMYSQDTKIQGKLLSEIDNKALPYASVLLCSASDSSVIKTTTTNKLGDFIIKGIKPEEYFIKINFVGYSEKLVKIIFDKDKKTYDLGTIILNQNSENLEEIKIEEFRIKGKDESEKTVYLLNEKIRQVASNGLEVLKQIPTINVDLFGNISLEGKDDILFLVNGITRDKEFISQLDPHSIDKVEIITNPSVKYDADVSGVINIVLKTDKKQGFSAGFTVEAPTPKAQIINPRLNLEYGTDNFRIYSQNNLNREFFTAKQITETSFNNSDYSFRKTGEGLLGFNIFNFNNGFDWFINEKNTFNFNVNTRLRTSYEKDFLFEVEEYMNNQLYEKQEILQDNIQHGLGSYYSVFYEKKFEDDGHKLSLEAGYYDYDGNDENNYKFTNYDIETKKILNIYSRTENIINKNNNIPLKIDYVKTFDKIKLETGYKTLIEWYDNKMTVENNNSTFFKYFENQQAGYLNLTGKFGTYKFQAGLRAEYSNILINEKTETDYFCILPQLSAFKELKKSQTIKISYRKRIFRPSINYLNPFEVWSDSIHLLIGNPDLTPSYSNDIELSYSKKFGSNFIQPKLFFEYVTDDFHTINYTNEENVNITKYDNIGITYNYGIGLATALQPFKWLKLNMDARLFNRIIKSEDTYSSYNQKVQQKISYSVSFNTIITPYKTWNIGISGFYNSPNIQYQQVNYRHILIACSIDKELFKNAKLSLVFVPPYVKDFIYRKRVIETPEINESWTGIVPLNYGFAVLKFTYNFNLGKNFRKLNRSMQNQDKGGASVL